jgi:hypothetical protein
MADRAPSSLFASFLQAGFECSTHRAKGGRRLDVFSSTGHDQFTRQDYRLMLDFGIRTVREGARWHVIETEPGVYDLSSLHALYDAADELGIEIILDIFHFGWPDFLDIFEPQFIAAFERFTAEIADFLRSRRYPQTFVVPVNEISFFSWAGADRAYINPFCRNRGHELKHQMVRVAVASTRILRDRVPGVRLVSPEPVIHIVGDPAIPGDEIEAAAYTRAMFEAWDMLSGRTMPELGGRPDYLDMIGINFYDRNEWVHNDEPITRDDPRYRPLHHILLEVWQRYRRPMFISETGAEDGARASWFNYVADEVEKAISLGVPIHGLCLYPILNHPGWDDDRHCHNGLFDYADANGRREMYRPLAGAIRKRDFKFDSETLELQNA